MKKIILLLCLLTSATAFAKFSGKGTGDKASPYQVTTAAQLDELRNCLKNNTYVKLMNDIDLTDYIAKVYPNGGWEPINCTDFDFWSDDQTYWYEVYFDGNNKTISGLSINRREVETSTGFFGVFIGEMKNLTVECNIFVDTKGSISTVGIGALCGYNMAGSFYNCEVGGKVTSDSPQIGGLCGINDDGTFELCKLKANSIVDGGFMYYVGGLCGLSYGGTFKKCYNYGTVDGGDEVVGGIVGRGSFNAENCHSLGTVRANMGIVGGIAGAFYSGVIKNCSSSGTISTKYKVAGGIVGSSYKWLGGGYSDDSYADDGGGTIINCSSNATVSAFSKVGGILGESHDPSFTIDGCYFQGIVKMKDLDGYDEMELEDIDMEAFGGIAGTMYGTISNCLTDQSVSPYRPVSGRSKVGGIVGCLRGKLVNSYANGNVTGDKYVGGLCGYVEGDKDHRASIQSSCNYNMLLEVNTKDGEIGRIAGHVGSYCDIPSISAAKSNRSDIYYPVKRMGVRLTSITENQQNGRNVARSLESERFFYESMGWDFGRYWWLSSNHGDVPSRFLVPYPLLYCCAGGSVTTGFHLRTENAVINKSTGGRVKMVMNHDASVNEVLGVQFDLVLPKGVAIKKKTNGQFDIQKMGVLAKHEVSCMKQADGSYRFMVFSLDMSRFDYEADYLMSIALDVADDVKCDYYDIIVKNVIYSWLHGDDATEVTSFTDHDTYNLLEITNGKLGDVNGDGTVTIADAMAIVDHVLGAPVPVFNEGNADVNGDGSIDITDVMTVVQWIVDGNKTYNLPQNSMEEMTVSREEGCYLLQLGNMTDYTALQMNVKLPEGCKLQGVELSDARSNGHQVVKHQLDDGSWNIVVWGVDGNELRNTSTDLLRLQTTGHGAGDVVVSDIILTNHGHENISIQAAAGGATGITEVEAGEPDGAIYDLNGVRVEHPTKGVYVRNGKKFVVK